MTVPLPASVPGDCPATVLVVDDERSLRDLLQSYLAAVGYTVLTAADGPQALHLSRTARPDLLVLDLLLPGLSGLEVCRRLRAFSDAYVLILSACADESDRVVGLAAGADDYLTKPFSPRELSARIRALLRRPRAVAPPAADPDPPPAVVGDLRIDHRRHEVARRGTPLPLTPHEYALLTTLATYPGQVFTRAQLLEQVWGTTSYDDHLLDVHMTNLRKKLAPDPAHPGYIETVRGVGYGLRRPAS